LLDRGGRDHHAASVAGRMFGDFGLSVKAGFWLPAFRKKETSTLQITLN
jgi:hypothetical protein